MLVVKLSVSLLLLAGMLYFVDIHQILEHLTSIGLSAILLAWLYYGLCQLFSAHRWQLLLKAKNIQVPLQKLFSFYMVGMFLNNFMPGAVGGDVVKAFDLYRYTRDVKASAATVFLERFTGLIGLTVIAAVSLVFSFAFISSWLIFLAVMGSVLFLLGVSLVLWSDKFFRGISLLYQTLLPVKVGQKLNDIHEAIYSFRAHKKTLLITVLYSLIIQLLFAMYYGLAAKVLGIEVQFFYFVLFLPIITIVTMIPLSIGGLGIREAAMVLLFNEVGIAAEDILSISLSVHIVNTLLSLWGGAIFVFRKQHSPKIPQPLPSEVSR